MVGLEDSCVGLVVSIPAVPATWAVVCRIHPQVAGLALASVAMRTSWKGRGWHRVSLCWARRGVDDGAGLGQLMTVVRGRAPTPPGFRHVPVLPGFVCSHLGVQPAPRGQGQTNREKEAQKTNEDQTRCHVHCRALSGTSVAVLRRCVDHVAIYSLL